jgi:hypothetical protein
VVAAEGSLLSLQSPLIELFGLAGAALKRIELRQIVDCDQRRVMILAERALLGCGYLLEKRLGLLVAPLLPIDARQIADVAQRYRGVLSELALGSVLHSQRDWFRLVISPLNQIEQRKAIERLPWVDAWSIPKPRSLASAARRCSGSASA